MLQMNRIRTICVYCGSGPGSNPRYIESAKALGKALAEGGIRLVFGGGSLGLMGALANSVLDHGGMVTDIIPDFLTTREHALTRVHETIITPDMHERKRLMFERADAFVALPGGVGTLEEVVEQLTWAQLGRHRKPILFANIAGFWDPLLVMFEHLLSLGFLTNGRLGYLVADNVDAILPTLTSAAAKVSEVEKFGEPERVERL